ncbi:MULTISPECIES: CHAT domain-containing tetratricopeptide repeat protein [unclassified Tolypothrix]|uniref:CHAT domain-containing tetratricopeptide repeat protein n=1 Tax=unclassified Tolypothrix TaxID=2649714 RepID=UPI0005EAB91E|nr:MULTISPECIES: CHAT domain-containing tetratricopeptide repeat protein [unclassified Tolypothrix]BAY93195.1 TPR domain protein [Microchaete diplosiphon NIES-3275]EKF00267.1 putative tetratricopeptide- repeat-containing domain protein [Tolypothrix sp. PCC 7601]MBE9082956.1 CHAT domain-containing protein [Tolypothrix sp. LEGE 11397]UYD27071.1 CHAT domain-containing protein [Tolypothrix sp. PCC 7712]UYD37071.1 CHAT domain-containing protein [Tolypothrix sp. PCC 7601]
MLKLYTFTCLLSLALLSESVGANATVQQTQIAQQPTTTKDATRTAAQTALNEGTQLYKQGTAESLRQAIEKWQEALLLWRKVGDKQFEAITFLGIGRIYDDLGEKPKALEYYSNALPLLRVIGDKGGEATTLNNIGLVYSDLGEKRKALEYFHNALPLRRAVGDKLGIATTLNNIAGVYSALGEKPKALEFYNNALLLIRAIGDKAREATALNNIGLVYSALGEKQKALEYYNNALPLMRVVGEKRGEATTLNNIGLIYSDLGEKQKALAYFNNVLPLRRTVGDKTGEAITLNNIGRVYDILGEKQKALEYYNHALPLYRGVGNRTGEAITLNNIGAVYDALGEKQKALELYNNALPLLRAVGDKAREATSLNNLGGIYDALGEKQKALEYYNNALLLRRAVGDKTGVANTLNNIGVVYDALGEKQKALEYYNNALLLRREVGDKAGEATTLTNIGTVYDALGNKQKALEYYNNALPLRRAVGDKAGEATTLNNIGLVYDGLGEKQKGWEFYNNALLLYRAVSNREGEATSLSNIALLEQSRGNLQAARTNIEAAIKIIEELRTKINSKELRSSYFATQQGVYKFYIDLLMELHKKDPSKAYDALALHYSERSRARSLIELLNEANAKILKGANPELIQQERDLRQKIDAKDTLRQNLQTSANKNDLVTKAALQRLSKEISNLLTQYQELQAKIRATSPVYAQLSNIDPEKNILKLPQIQQQLDKDTLLLQYSLGEERSYLWAVTPTSMQVYTLPPRQEIEKLTQQLIQDLKSPIVSEATIASSKKLSQIILAPVADKLPGKRLVIVADGALQTLPFAALPDLSATKYQPLMVNHEIVNLPSASTIAFQRQQLANRKPAPKALAILADPVYSATDERVTGKTENTSVGSNLELERSALERSARSLKRSGWDRLVNTATEAKEILKLLPASSRLEALNFDANYNQATSKALNQFRILHFATHGFVNQDQPQLSGIVLSLFDQKGTPISGYLRLADLFNQDYPAELIVLSACETGLGKNVNGEGLIGLTRGLMYAGAARVAVSLWQVSDEGTSILMQEFYKQMLQQNKTPASAMRAAQTKLWQDGRSPYEWAAFTVQGEWR